MNLLTRERILLFAVGTVTILGQVTLLRELMVAFYGSELIVILAIGILMLSSAAGVISGRSVAQAGGRKTGLFFLIFAVTLPAIAIFLRSYRVLFGEARGAYLPFFKQLADASIALVPFGILAGLLFYCAARTYIEEGQSLAVAYGIESIGGLVGGVMVTVMMATGFSNLTALILCALVAAICSLADRDSHSGISGLLTGMAVTSALLLLLVFSSPVDRNLTSMNHPGLVDSIDTPYGRISITRLSGQVTIFENDALAYESQEIGAEAFVNMAGLLVERPDEVLILGGGAYGLVSEVLKHGPERVTDIELDRKAYETALKYLPSESTASMQHPKVQLSFGDPRRFLEEGRTHYDLILIGMSEPESGSSNRFYTKEFFKACASHLDQRGVIAFRLRSSENYWTPALARRSAGIYLALKEAFPNIAVYFGGTNIYVASNSPIVQDPEILSSRFITRRIEARLVCPEYIAYILGNDRQGEIENRLKNTKEIRNSDERPVCYLYTLILWLSRFFPALGSSDFAFPISGVGGTVLKYALAPVLIFFGVLLLPFLKSLRKVALACVAGFWGMIMEGAVMLGFQARSGALFMDLGLLLAAFMGGLAAGSFLFPHLFDEGRRFGKYPRTGGLIVLALSAGTSMLAAVLLDSDLRWGRAVAFLLLLLAGFLVGAIFAAAAVGYPGGQGSAVSPLYAADIAGGAAGSVIGALFLLPLAGLPASAVIVSVLSLCALILLA